MSHDTIVTTGRVILTVLAMLLFGLAAVLPQPDPWPGRLRLIAAGLCFWALSDVRIGS